MHVGNVVRLRSMEHETIKTVLSYAVLSETQKRVVLGPWPVSGVVRPSQGVVKPPSFAPSDWLVVRALPSLIGQFWRKLTLVVQIGRRFPKESEPTQMIFGAPFVLIGILNISNYDRLSPDIVYIKVIRPSSKGRMSTLLHFYVCFGKYFQPYFTISLRILTGYCL